MHYFKITFDISFPDRTILSPNVSFHYQLHKAENKIIVFFRENKSTRFVSTKKSGNMSFSNF